MHPDPHSPIVTEETPAGAVIPSAFDEPLDPDDLEDDEIDDLHSPEDDGDLL